MAIKRSFDITNPKNRTCLKCGQTIERRDLKDDEIFACGRCGQKHFVDMNGRNCTMTVIERPELRRRPEIITATDLEVKLCKRIKELEGQLAAEKKNSKEWEEAADGLARMVENLTAEKNGWNETEKGVSSI